MSSHHGAIESSKALTEEDRQRLDHVDQVLADARDLKAWWDATDSAKAYRETFALAATHNRPDSSFGFFDEATVGGEKMAVMGNVQEQFFDRPKIPAEAGAGAGKAEKAAVEWTRRQVEEFVLRYFMRVSDFSTPRAFPDDEGDPPPAFLRPFSLCPETGEERKGFGFELAYFKKPGEKPGKFADEGKYAIVDLREIGEGKKYEWIVVKVDIFDFKAEAAPFGHEYPFGTVPLTEESYLVLAADFITQETYAAPRDGLVGRYGFGYGFLRDLDESVLGYGPGRFDAGFQLIDFHVRDDGEIRSRLAFVANRPRKVTNVSLDPFKWGLNVTDMISFGMLSGMLGPIRSAYRQLPQMPGVDLAQLYVQFANMLSAGAAERRLCISKKQLEKIFLVKHFAQHYNVVAGALVTWRMIPDWFEHDGYQLPDWVKSGVST
jgi:hypothetical protein